MFDFKKYFVLLKDGELVEDINNRVVLYDKSSDIFSQIFCPLENLYISFENFQLGNVSIKTPNDVSSDLWIGEEKLSIQKNYISSIDYRISMSDYKVLEYISDTIKTYTYNDHIFKQYDDCRIMKFMIYLINNNKFEVFDNFLNYYIESNYKNSSDFGVLFFNLHAFDFNYIFKLLLQTKRIDMMILFYNFSMKFHTKTVMLNSENLHIITESFFDLYEYIVAKYINDLNKSAFISVTEHGIHYKYILNFIENHNLKMLKDSKDRNLFYYNEILECILSNDKECLLYLVDYHIEHTPKLKDVLKLVKMLVTNNNLSMEELLIFLEKQYGSFDKLKSVLRLEYVRDIGE